MKVRQAADDGAFKRSPIRFPRGLWRHSARLPTVRVRGVRGLGLFGTTANSLFLRSGKYYDLATKNQSQIRSRKDYEACVSLKTHQAFTRYDDNHVGAFNAAALFSLRDEILQISHTAL